MDGWMAVLVIIIIIILLICKDIFPSDEMAAIIFIRGL